MTNQKYKVITAGASAFEDATKLLAERVEVELRQGWILTGGAASGPTQANIGFVFYHVMQAVSK